MTICIHQGFTRTASTLAVEGKHVLQSISVHGPIRSLTDVLSDYATLKEREIEKAKARNTFFNDTENEGMFADIWDQFSSLMADYKYYRNRRQSADYAPGQHNKYKRRRLNNIDSDTHRRSEEQMLFELNTNRFNEILQNSQLHEQMAQLIQTQYDIQSRNSKRNPPEKKPAEIVDSMMAMDEHQFDKLFVPLPLDQYENQKDGDETNKTTDKSSDNEQGQKNQEKDRKDDNIQTNRSNPSVNESTVIKVPQ